MTPEAASGAGAGPLYEHTPEGERAAQEEVVIPRPEGAKSDAGQSEGEGHPKAGPGRER